MTLTLHYRNWRIVQRWSHTHRYVLTPAEREDFDRLIVGYFKQCEAEQREPVEREFLCLARRFFTRYPA